MVSTELFIVANVTTQLNLALDFIKYIVYNYYKYIWNNKNMRKSTRSILQELSDIGLSRDTELVIESRGSNIIQSAINLIEMIRENYDIETAAELERRFLNSIKSGDGAKFKRGIKRIQESKDK